MAAQKDGKAVWYPRKNVVLTKEKIKKKPRAFKKPQPLNCALKTQI